jgi:hypothetical protein
MLTRNYFGGIVILVAALAASVFQVPYSSASISLSETPAVFQMGRSTVHARLVRRSSGFSTLGEVVADSPQHPAETGEFRIMEITPAVASGTAWLLSGDFTGRLRRLSGLKAALGLDAEIPASGVVTDTVGSPYAFTVMRQQRTDFSVSPSFRIYPNDWLSFGLRYKLLMAASASATSRLTTDNPTAAVTLNSGPVGALLVSASVQAGDQEFEVRFRQKSRSGMAQEVFTSVELASGVSMSQPVSLRTTTHFEPSAVSLRWLWRGSISWMAGLRYENWLEYEPPFLVVETRTANSRAIATKLPAVIMRNTLSPSVGIGKEFSDSTMGFLRYEFKPSPLVSTEANLLDSDLHSIGVELATEFTPDLLGESGVRCAVFADYGRFTKRFVERINPSQPGWPGYSFSGHTVLIGVGATLFW